MNVLILVLTMLLAWSGTALAENVRVVTLAPNLTDLVCRLNAGCLVGRAEHDTCPPEAVDCAVVGPYFRPDIEKIAALHPDVCLTIRGGAPQKSLERLRELGIRVAETAPDTFAGLRESVLLAGKELHCEQRAEELATQLDMQLEAIAEKLVPITSRPGVLFQIQASPPIFAGSGTFLDEMIRRAGGRNLASANKGWPLLGMEEALAMEPDAIILPQGIQADQAIRIWRRFPHIPAVRENRLHIVPEDLFSQPTLRSTEALAFLAALLHPEAAALFSGSDAPWHTQTDMRAEKASAHSETADAAPCSTH